MVYGAVANPQTLLHSVAPSLFTPPSVFNALYQQRASWKQEEESGPEEEDDDDGFDINRPVRPPSPTFTERNASSWEEITSAHAAAVSLASEPHPIPSPPPPPAVPSLQFQRPSPPTVAVEADEEEEEDFGIPEDYVITSIIPPPSPPPPALTTILTTTSPRITLAPVLRRRRRKGRNGWDDLPKNLPLPHDDPPSDDTIRRILRDYVNSPNGPPLVEWQSGLKRCQLCKEAKQYARSVGHNARSVLFHPDSPFATTKTLQQAWREWAMAERAAVRQRGFVVHRAPRPTL